MFYMKKNQMVMEYINNNNSIVLKEKWTISKGYETYGYNICSLWCGGLWRGGIKVASCNGGGYDMQSTVISNFINLYFQDRLNSITSENFEYGLYENVNGNNYISYGIGVNAINKIIQHCGMNVKIKEVKVKRHYEKYIIIEWQ